jgi:hypothetical protein
MLRAIVIATAHTLLLTGIVSAADLYTPPLAYGTSDTATCDITNVSAQTRSFTFQLIDTSGTVRVSGANTLPPGASGGGGTFGPTLANELFHCHFDVGGTKAQFRAAIKRRDASGGDIVVVPAE